MAISENVVDYLIIIVWNCALETENISTGQFKNTIMFVKYDGRWVNWGHRRQGNFTGVHEWV